MNTDQCPGASVCCNPSWCKTASKCMHLEDERMRPKPDRCAILLATLLQYARHPATLNAPRWVGFLVPSDVLPEIESALADALARGA